MLSSLPSGKESLILRETKDKLRNGDKGLREITIRPFYRVARPQVSTTLRLITLGECLTV